MTAPALVADGITVRLGGRDVLRDVSVSIGAGEVVALIGPNGAGKSTLLGALAGDLRCVGGSVRLHDRPLDDWSRRDLAQARAVLPQSHQVALPFTVAEVVGMGRAPWPAHPAADRRIVADALAATGTTVFASARFADLSGGEQARVALARVLAQRTSVLLLDEPTASLDLRHQDQVFATARSSARRGVAVGVVVHDLTLAAAHADRLVLLAAGEVVAVGAPADVLRPDVLSPVYGCDVDVIAHPTGGAPLVTVRRPSVERTLR